MRNPWKLLLLLPIFCFVACSGDPEEDAPDGYTSQVPNIPDSYEFDLDDDGMADYSLAYWVLQDFPQISILSITGRFIPLGLNEVLLKHPWRELYLSGIEEIENEVSEPLFWLNTSFNIVGIGNHVEKGWPLEWSIYCETEYDSYFLGLKLKKDNLNVMGWVELQVNKSNGHVSIVDKGVF